MNIEKIAGSKVKFEVIIPVETFKKAVDAAFEKKVKEVEVPGFRKGACPRSVFEARFGVEALYNDALNEAISETYYNAITENNIDACAYPKIDLDENKINQTDPIHYTVEVAVYPVVELGEYKGLEIEKEKVSVTAKEVNDQIEATLNRNAMLVKKAGEDVKIEKGDTVVFDYEGLKDGVAFDGGTAKDYSLEIGSGQFIPGFEDQMVGLKEGEQKDLNLTFPEEYHAKELAGAPVVFKVNIKEIKSKEVPALDDEFVKDQKIEGVETVDAYKKHIKEEITERKETQALNKAKNDLYQKVIENAKFELADELVEGEAQYSVEQAEAQAKQYGLPLETLLQYTGQGTLEQFKENAKAQARNSLALRFVLKEIAKAEKFEAQEEEIEKKFNEIAEQYKLSVEQVKAQVAKSAIVEEIVSERAYKFLEEACKFVAPTAKSKKSE